MTYIKKRWFSTVMSQIPRVSRQTATKAPPKRPVRPGDALDVASGDGGHFHSLGMATTITLSWTLTLSHLGNVWLDRLDRLDLATYDCCPEFRGSIDPMADHAIRLLLICGWAQGFTCLRVSMSSMWLWPRIALGRSPISIATNGDFWSNGNGQGSKKLQTNNRTIIVPPKNTPYIYIYIVPKKPAVNLNSQS